MPIKNKKDRRAAKISEFSHGLRAKHQFNSVTLTVDELAEIMCIAALKATNKSEAYVQEHVQTAKLEYYAAAAAVYRHKAGK